MHPNSLGNLKKGKKFGSGQPTNLGGAPKGKRVSNYFKKIAQEDQIVKNWDDEATNTSTTEAICLAITSRALQGDVKAAGIILEFLKEKK